MEKVISASIEHKKKIVKELAEQMKSYKTVMIVSTKGLPSAQFHAIKKSLRGTVDIRVAKKSIVIRAITATEKGALQNMKEQITSDVALFLSDEDPFELSGRLTDNMSSTKAKPGDVAPEDIRIEPGPTNLPPGPAISELSGVGLKVVVEGGKLAIKDSKVVVKKGDIITDKMASVLGKLDVTPLKVGFIPLAAYDATSGKIYVGIRIDKKEFHEQLQTAIAKSLGFAVNVKYPTEKTIAYFIAKAGLEEKAIEKLINNQSNKEEAK